ncbi:MAG: hypothetical protein ACK41C_14750 [Phenylobacterium sp.]|uniref:hypothetical protein n=1 Tax=Phenylobacterium sp. TaxID=1871053 RepID=UPI00391A00D0
MANSAIGARAEEPARNLALINYALLFSSIFFAGVTALIAVVIAYSQRDDAPPTLRSHHDFQIRIFWIAFGLTVAAGLSILGAAIGVVAELLEVTRLHGWNGWGEVRVELSRLSLGPFTVLAAVLAGAFWFLTCLWLAAAPLLGFIRLASAQGMGHSARL